MTKTKIIPGDKAPKKKLGVDSVEASALMLSEGYTKDPEEALAYDQEFNDQMDKEMRAKLRDAMGFDFKIKMQGNRMTITSKDKPRVRVHTFINPGDKDDYDNIVSEALIQRMVDACLRLKAKWDAKHEEIAA